MKDRIKQIIDGQHLTQQSFANLTGISPATICGILTGRSQPTLKVVDAIQKSFPTISLDWLVNGTLPMYKDVQAEEVLPASSHHPTDNEPTLDFGTDPLDTIATSAEAATVRGVSDTLKKNIKTEVKYIDKNPRRITEIRIFYDDQTWETFVPKK